MQRTQVVSVHVRYFSQHYLVAMATYLDKSKNEVQIDHLHPKRLYSEKIPKMGPVRRYSTKYAFFAVSYQKFTRAHDIEASFVLFTRTLRQPYPIPFWNVRVTIESLPFFHKIGCHGNVLEISKKRSRSIICTQNALIW